MTNLTADEPGGTTRRSFLRLSGVAAASMGSAWASVGLAGEDKAEPQNPDEKLPGRIFVFRAKVSRPGPLAIDPNDHTWATIPARITPIARVSPDGRKLVGLLRPISDAAPWVTVIDLESKNANVPLVGPPGGVALMSWSADSKEVVLSFWSSGNEVSRFEAWKFSADGSQRTKIALPETEYVQDWSPDGRWFITKSARPPRQAKDLLGLLATPSYLIQSDGTGERILIEGPKDGKPSFPIPLHRFSPDGRTVMFVEWQFTREQERIRQSTRSLWLIDVDGKNRRCIIEGTPDDHPLDASWSPDGRWLAVSRWKKVKGLAPNAVAYNNGQGSVEIVDRGGRTKRMLRLPESPMFTTLDWR